MKSSEQPLSRLDQEMLDGLVDGELSETERRALLKRLDQTPGGWRACALAFLEAQCFREAFAREATAREPSAISQPATQAAPPPTTIPLAGGARGAFWIGPRARQQWVLAASVLVALAAGWWAGATLRVPIGPSSTPTGAAYLASNEQPTAEQELVQATDSAAPSAAAPMMTLALPSWSGEGPVHLPVVEHDELHPSLLYPDAQSFPANLREALRRAGYEVRHSRNLMPVRVEDGRHAIVPVDQVDIHYVGNHVE